MHNFIVLDLETGGLDAKENPITEIAFIVLDWKNLAVIDEYQSFVKPYDDLIITEEALAKTQVSMQQINNGAEVKNILRDISEKFKQHLVGKYNKPILVGHNIGFDISFLEELYNNRNKSLYDFVDRIPYDTQRMIKAAEGKVKGADKHSNKLGVVAERLGLRLKSAHGAMADVKTTADVFKKLIGSMRKINSDEQEHGQKEGARDKSRNFFELKFPVQEETNKFKNKR